MSTDLSQLRICVEKTPVISITDVNNKNKDQYKAAFLIESIWDKNQEITVQFIGEDNDINWTTMETLLDTKDSNGNIIPIDPLENVVRKMKIKEAVVHTITKRIMPLIGLKIKFVNTNGMIRITFDKTKGSYSLVGKQALTTTAGSETLNYGWADVGTFVHEFMHSLGAIHEHQNPKGNTIDWNKPEVYKWAQDTQGWTEEITNKNIIDRYKSDQINGSDFDANSIMLYFYPF
jgi:hypothetical protein